MFAAPRSVPWFPYRLPRGRLAGVHAINKSCRGFPTDFPVVGFDDCAIAHLLSRGFPTDFPMVGYSIMLAPVV